MQFTWELLVFGALFLLVVNYIGFMMLSHHTTIHHRISDDEIEARGELAKIRVKAEAEEANFIMGIKESQAKTDAIMMRRRSTVPMRFYDRR